MSQDLQTKINQLTQQLDGHTKGAEALSAQLDAHKGMLNESLTASLQLKAHSILLDKQNKKLQTIIDELNKQVSSLNKQLEDATAKIASLEKPSK